MSGNFNLWHHERRVSTLQHIYLLHIVNNSNKKSNSLSNEIEVGVLVLSQLQNKDSMNQNDKDLPTHKDLQIIWMLNQTGDNKLSTLFSYKQNFLNNILLPHAFLIKVFKHT